MKSIKQQYIDLREGNMSQANFMRNIRMSLPQYVTNITSFEDSVKILKNKGILTEADIKDESSFLYRDPSTVAKAVAEEYNDVLMPLRKAINELPLVSKERSQLTREYQGKAFGFAVDEMEKAGVDKKAIRKYISYDEDWAMEYSNALSDELKAGGFGEEEIMEGNMQEEEWTAAFDTAINRDMNLSPENRELINRALDHVNPYTDYRDMNPAEAAAEFVEDVLYSQEADNDYNEDDEKEAERINMMIDQELENRFDENKSLREAKDEKGKWTNANGKSMYDQFKELDNLNGQEVLIGLDWEMEKNPELSKAAAAKIVIKNLKKNSIYYTMADLAGKEGAEAEYMGGKSAQPEARQMQPLEKNLGNIVDKAMGMKPVKDVEKAKKDSDKGGETNKAVKGITLMSLIAKTVRGLKKMDATGEKMKTVKLNEGEYTTNWDFTASQKQKIKDLIDDAEFDVEEEEDTVKTTVTSQKHADKNIEHAIKQATGQLKSSPIKPGIGNAIQKPLKETAEDHLSEQISTYIKEITGVYGGDAMDAEDGSSYINEAEDAGTFVNKIFSTAKALGLVQMNMTDTDADIKKFTANFQKEGFPPNSHGILGVAKISGGMAISLVIMTDDKAVLDKLEDVIDNTKGNFKPDSNFSNKSRIYKIQNAAKDKEAFVHQFHIDLTSKASSTPTSESIEKAVNESLNSFRKGK